MPRLFQIACLLVFSSILSYSQTTASQTAAAPVLTFTVDFPNSQPEHYSIRVQSDGPAHYQSSGRLSADTEATDPHDSAPSNAGPPDSASSDSASSDSAARDSGSHDSDSHDSDSHNKDSFDLDFTLGAALRQKIFDLAAKAGYFQKDIASHHKGMAFTGKKTLTYKDARRAGEATYNYSSNAAAEELTDLLQSLSATLEFGHRLQYDRHYQKLALDEELKRMEEMASSNQLIEVAAIQPILDEIIADQSVINVTRARAQRLLDRASVH